MLFDIENLLSDSINTLSGAETLLSDSMTMLSAAVNLLSDSLTMLFGAGNLLLDFKMIRLKGHSAVYKNSWVFENENVFTTLWGKLYKTQFPSPQTSPNMLNLTPPLKPQNLENILPS